MAKVITAIMLVTVAAGLGFNILNVKSPKTNLPDEKNEQLSRKQPTGRYLNYSRGAYNDSKNMKRVLFFHAPWCPTCKVANEEFMSQQDKIPEDAVLLKTDYDTEQELKSKYGITYQHTFVLVDMDGNEIRKWNGGGIEELVNNI